MRTTRLSVLTMLSLLAWGCVDRPGTPDDDDGAGDDDTGGDDDASDDDAGDDDAGDDDTGDDDSGPADVEVLLYTGDGGGGPPTDLYPESLLEILEGGGVTAEIAATVPVDAADRFGTIVVLNPQNTLSPSIIDASVAVAGQGGRIVVIYERLEWGNVDQVNVLLGKLGSTLTAHSEESSAGRADLSVTPVGPLTDGIGDLATYYSASLELGQHGVALGADGDGVPVIAWQDMDPGEVLVIADSTMMGYYLAEADNSAFVLNFAAF